MTILRLLIRLIGVKPANGLISIVVQMNNDIIITCQCIVPFMIVIVKRNQ